MAPLSNKTRLRVEKGGLFLLMIMPLLCTAYLFATNHLGANPVEAATHRTGVWSLRFLLAALAVTPLRIAFSWRRPLLFRRMIGLFSFAYAMAHFGIYLVFDQELDFSDTLADVAKRPYITVGFAALVLMLPLAFTSNAAMLKKLGAKRWRRLHKLTYVVAILAVIHFLWLVKADMREPGMYGGILAALFVVRMHEKIKVMKIRRQHPAKK